LSVRAGTAAVAVAAAATDGAPVAPAPFNLTSDAFAEGEAERERARADKKRSAEAEAERIAAIIAETDAKIEQARAERLAREAAQAAANAAMPPPPPRKKAKTMTVDGVTIRVPSNKFRNINRRTGKGQISGLWKVSKGTTGVQTLSDYTKLGRQYRRDKRPVRWRWEDDSSNHDSRHVRAVPACCHPQPWFKK